MAELKRAQELIRKNLTTLPMYAKPYAKALLELNDLAQTYGADSGQSIKSYFLANAGTWRGEDARECKRLLRGI